MADQKPRRPRRTKASIIACIQQAAEDEIRESGFASSLVTDIIKRAKIEPQVFYNRYRDLDEYYDTFVKKYDYWITDTIKEVKVPLVSHQGYREIFQQLIEKINTDDIILEILRWEVSESNDTTHRTAAMRELHTSPLTQGYVREFNSDDTDIMAFTAMILGGIYYLSLHKKLSPFYGIDMSTPEGRERISIVVNKIIDGIFERRSIEADRARIAARLREAGVDESVIQSAIAD